MEAILESFNRSRSTNITPFDIFQVFEAKPQPKYVCGVEIAFLNSRSDKTTVVVRLNSRMDIIYDSKAANVVYDGDLFRLNEKISYGYAWKQRFLHPVARKRLHFNSSNVKIRY